VLTENLWPKLFSEAPRCAPLRLNCTKASGVPSRKSHKLNDEEIFSPVGIAQPEKDLLRGNRRNRSAKTWLLKTFLRLAGSLGVTLGKRKLVFSQTILRYNQAAVVPAKQIRALSSVG
jgi:hypothetical protein